MKKALIFSLLSTVIILVGCTISKSTPVNNDQAGIANPASVNCEQKGGTLEIRTDATGSQVGYCKFSDGSECEEWAFYRGECQPVSEKDKTSKIEEAIKPLFAQKYNKELSEISVRINQQDESHVRGSVLFGQTGLGEGGNFLAAKVDGGWQLVFDGNGQISCALVEPYNFPAAMISDCAQ